MFLYQLLSHGTQHNATYNPHGYNMIAHSGTREHLVIVFQSLNPYAFSPVVACLVELGQNQVATHGSQHPSHILDVLHLRFLQGHCVSLWQISIVGHRTESKATLQSVGILRHESHKRIVSTRDSHVPLKMFPVTFRGVR